MIAPAQSDVPHLALSSADAAEALGISDRHLSTLACEGKIPSLMLGHRRVFPVDVLREWMRSQCGKWLADGGAEAAD